MDAPDTFSDLRSKKAVTNARMAVALAFSEPALLILELAIFAAIRLQSLHRARI
jgi:hypothetical protein